MPKRVIKRSKAGAVDVTALKFHLRLVVEDGEEYTLEDNLLQEYIRAATEEYEDTYKTALITQQLEWQFDGFSRKMELARPPLQSVESVIYFDTDGQEQEVDAANYSVVTSALPGYVLFHTDYTFPELHKDTPHPVRIQYTAGYGDSFQNVSSSLRVWLMNIIGTMYKNRDSMLVGFGAPVSVHDLRKAMSGLIAGKPKGMRFG